MTRDDVVSTKGETTGGVDFAIDSSGLGLVRGIVRLNGQPAENAGIDLVLADRTVIGTISEPDGSFVIPGVEPGEYSMEVSLDGATTEAIAVSIVAGERTTQDVNLAPAISLRGSVKFTLPSGVETIADLPLNLITPAEETLLLLTDENGEFGADELVPGSYILMLQDGSNRHEFTIDAQSASMQVDVVLPAGSLVGEVTSATGFGLGDVVVDLVANGQVVDTTSTNFRGVYAFPLVSPGRYSIQLSSETHSFPVTREVSVEAGSYVEVESVAGSSRLSLSFVDHATSLPVTDPVGFALQPLDGDGRYIRSMETETGFAAVDNIQPGQYRLLAHDGDALYQWVITVNETETLREQVLGPVSRLGGVLRNAAGQAVADASIVITSRSQPELRWHAVTDNTGRYELSLPRGDYRVTVEVLSKPSEYDEEAGELHESVEEVSVVLMTHKELTKALKPCDGSLDDPSALVSAEFAPVLGCPAFSTSAMGAHQVDAPTGEAGAQPVRIRSLVVQKVLRHVIADTHVDQGFDRVHLGVVGGQGECRQRNALAVDHQHQLAAFASFGLANVKTPFFAGENVPSPMACDQYSSFRRSIRLTSLRQASSQTPDSVHSRCLRWHVEGEGYRSGKSCHRAPFLSTQMMPSRQSRGLTRGRPPFGERGGSRNKSRMMAHWASVMKGFGAVLDPVVFGRRRGGHSDREIVIA